MSDYDLPSQFVDESLNEENFDDLLDLELFGDDQSGPDVDGEQGLNPPDESTNQQDVAPSGTPDVQDQQQEVPSNVDVLPPLDFEDFLEPQDFVAHPHPTELGAVDPSSTGQPTRGLTNLEQLPEFDFGVFDSQEWQDYANTGADRDIDDILGTHVPGVDSGYHTAAISRETTHGLTPAAHHIHNAVGRPGPSNVQLGPRATTTAARHPRAKEYSDIDDESDGSSVSDDVGYETYRENDPLIVEDPPKEKWGRTGKRIGQEVWFNPESNKWRKFHSFHFSGTVSPNSMQNHRHLIMI